ncbi:MAG: hypothetical protein KGY67_00340 [Candidatus Thermoplasmatota archaeon]|nr:hypothetical protein [Candidatus Thermoplasmatota archaeon]
MARKKSGHDFIWKHKDGEKETTLMFPLKINNAVDRDWKPDTNMVCNECEHQLKQFYICTNCNEKYRMGEIKKRHDKENNIVYNTDEMKQYKQEEITQNIQVEKEIPMKDVLPNIFFIKNQYELYNNDEQYDDVVKKIFNYLKKKEIALLVTYGKSNKMRSGIITATDRLTLLEIRDYQLIRHKKQINIESEPNKSTEILQAISETQEPKLYQEFIEKLMNGEEIKISEKKQEAKAIVNADFLEL